MSDTTSLDPQRDADFDALEEINDKLGRAGLLLCDALVAAHAAGEPEFASRITSIADKLVNEVLLVTTLVALGRNLEGDAPGEDV